MKRTKKWPPNPFVIKFCKQFSSPSTRALSAIAKAAGEAAVRKAAEAGIQIAVWKDGAVVKIDPNSVDLK